MPPSAPTAYSVPSAGRTSMPSTLPLTPWIFQVLVTDLLLVLTIEMVLSPDSAATSAACTETAPTMTAADAARMVRNCIALSLGFAVARCDRRGTAWGGGRMRQRR